MMVVVSTYKLTMTSNDLPPLVLCRSFNHIAVSLTIWLALHMVHETVMGTK
jgi:hypothetical protein